MHRLGAFPDRSLDVDVIFDLMIHDLDLLLAAVGSEVVSIEAVGVNVLTPKTDIANARLRFASGCIANLTASRISRDRVRKARFFQRRSYVSIDFAAREVEVYRLVAGDGRPAIDGGRLEVPNDEPLRRELEDFVHAIRDGRAPGVTAAAGRDALALATRVAEAMRQEPRSRTAMIAASPFDQYLERIAGGRDLEASVIADARRESRHPSGRHARRRAEAAAPRPRRDVPAGRRVPVRSVVRRRRPAGGAARCASPARRRRSTSPPPPSAVPGRWRASARSPVSRGPTSSGSPARRARGERAGPPP